MASTGVLQVATYSTADTTTAPEWRINIVGNTYSSDLTPTYNSFEVTPTLLRVGATKLAATDVPEHS